MTNSIGIVTCYSVYAIGKVLWLELCSLNKNHRFVEKFYMVAVNELKGFQNL